MYAGVVVVSNGARFFDGTRLNLGRARQVARRESLASTLTVLDVVGAEPELARILCALDRGRLRIEVEDAEHTCYTFRWASGYENGPDIRVQGTLEPRLARHRSS